MSLAGGDDEQTTHGRSSHGQAAQAEVVHLFRGPAHVSFDHRELRAIMNVYGRQVAAGEWRDYAIDFLKDRAVFSVFRRASEVPLYRIEKVPELARRQGAYAVLAGSGLVLKRGQELERVLRVLDRKLVLVT